MTTITRLVVILSLGLVLFGCSKTSATDSSAAPEPTYDLEAIMRGFAETYRTENEILAKAIRSFDSINDDDRRNYFSALQVRMRLGDEWKAMSLAHPSWILTSCDWFESVVETLYFENMRLGVQLGRHQPKASDGRNRARRLYLDAAGSEEAATAYSKWSRDNAGSPRNIFGLCSKLEKLPQLMEKKLEDYYRADKENQ